MADRRAMRVGPDRADVARARRFVTASLDEWGMSDRDDVALVTSELVTNACEHAGHPIIVTIERDGPRLRLEVSDGSAVLPIVRALDHDRRDGRGMFIVEQLTSRWGAESTPDGGKTVWVEFPPDAPA